MIPEHWDSPILDSIAQRGSGHTAASVTPAGIANSSAVVHPAATVVLSRDAGVGKSAIMKCDMAVSQHFMAWQCGAKLDNVFLYYWLQAKKPEFERIAMGNTIKTIGLPYFRELLVPLPRSSEQETIAEALSEADALIESLELLLTKKRHLKLGAMQELLTGKKRLPGFTAEWEKRSFDSVLERLNAKAHQIQAHDYQGTGQYPVVDQGKNPVIGYSDRLDKR